MIYLIFGRDTFRSRQKLQQLVSNFMKRQGLAVFKVDPDSFSEEFFEGLFKGSSLFYKKTVAICERLLEDNQAKDFVIGHLSQCAASPNIFLFWEEEPAPACLEALKKQAAKVQKFELYAGSHLRNWIRTTARSLNINLLNTEVEVLAARHGTNLWGIKQELEKMILLGNKLDVVLPQETNLFRISDAIAKRQRRFAWILYQQAILRGVSPEEIFWKVAWQIKNLLLVKSLSAMPYATIVRASGLHPFVVKKSLEASHLFTEQELLGYSRELIELYHQIRRGNADMKVGLERFMLRI